MNKNSPLLFSPGSLVDDVTIYHDETKGALGKTIWGHGLLFIPERTKPDLLRELHHARDETCCSGKLHFAKISERSSTPKYKCSEKWIKIAVKYLRRKRGCKLGIIFFDKKTIDLNFYSGNKKEKTLRLMETVLRMVLKGSVHYLYNKRWKVRLHKIITDGKPWHRKLDEARILKRLLPEVREYVEILPFAEIESVLSDHNNDKCNDKESAYLLQLTDLLLGSTIHCCFRELKEGERKERIIRPVREMLDKRKRGKNFQNSSHYRSFTLSLAKIVNGEWVFESLDTKEIIINNDQITIFNLSKKGN